MSAGVQPEGKPSRKHLAPRAASALFLLAALSLGATPEASIWYGKRFDIDASSPPPFVAGLTWVTVGYDHVGDLKWHRGERIWLKTDRGWVRDSLAYVLSADLPPRYYRLGEHDLWVPRDRLFRQRSKSHGIVGTVLFAAIPGPCDGAGEVRIAREIPPPD